MINRCYWHEVKSHAYKFESNNEATAITIRDCTRLYSWSFSQSLTFNAISRDKRIEKWENIIETPSNDIVFHFFEYFKADKFLPLKFSNFPRSTKKSDNQPDICMYCLGKNKMQIDRNTESRRRSKDLKLYKHCHWEQKK